jgi:hypothetical protein
VRALATTARVLIGLGVVLYLALSSIYDLEGGYWFWKLTLVCATYLGLWWVGIESAARGLLDWKGMAVLLAAQLVAVARHFIGSQAG